MQLLLIGGLNLNDPFTLGEQELAVALNADFRQKGVVRSRNGRSSVYTSQGTTLIGMADTDVYSVGSYIYHNGVALGTGITGATALGVAELYNTNNEVLLLSAQNNYKVDGSSVTLWGIAAPTVAPTVSAAAGGGMTVGTYYYKYTYARYVSGVLVHESNPSPVSASVATSGGNLQVSFTGTAPTDGQVTHLNVYRTLVGGASGGVSFFFDQSITLPTVTATSSNTDTQLGTLVETDNDPPPSTGLNAIAGPGAFNVIFVAAGNTVYYSKPRRPESFPADNYSQVGVPSQTIMGMVDWGGLMFLLTTTTIYYLQGTDPASFYPVKTQASRGLVSRQGAVATDQGIIYVAYDGIYVFNGQSELKLTGAKVDSLFRGETINDVEPINLDALDATWLVYFNSKLMFGYPIAGNTQPTKVLVFDLEEKKWSIYDYNLTLLSAYVDETNKRLLAGDSAGNIWQLETGTSDGGSAFTFKVRSREVSGLAVTSPGFIRHDVTNVGGETIYARLLSKGVVVHTTTLTDSTNYKRRVIGPQSYDSLQFELETSTDSRVIVGAVELL